MDHTMIQSLEKLLQEKIMLYNDLLQHFRKERESLINIDLDKLWRISKEKEELCSRIKIIRQEIMTAMTNPTIDLKIFSLKQILDLIPTKNKAKFQRLNRTLINLKGEIEVLRKENMSLIDDSLQFLDEMISIIAGQSKCKPVYDERCHLSRSGAPILLSREA